VNEWTGKQVPSKSRSQSDARSIDAPQHAELPDIENYDFLEISRMLIDCHR
jgi:hypothetical protein